jgi:hypothetical protein
VTVVSTDVLQEIIASIFRAKKRARNVTAYNFLSSAILSTLMAEALRYSETSVLTIAAQRHILEGGIVR